MSYLETFNALVKAAKTSDIWTIEQFYRAGIISPIDDYKIKLNLTPAGKLACEEEWEAVELLWEGYGAKTDGILFGAVLGGLYETIQLNFKGSITDSNSVLAKICAEHCKLYKDEKKSECHWNPVIKALAISKKSDTVDAILSQYSLEDSFKNGLLESAVQGAAYAGDTARVRKLLGCLENRGLLPDEAVGLSKIMKGIEKSALEAAAQGGREELVKFLLKLCENKFKQRNLDVNEEKVKKSQEKHIIVALTGAAREKGNKGLVKDFLLARYDNLRNYTYRRIPTEFVLSACQTQQYTLLKSILGDYHSRFIKETFSALLKSSDRKGVRKQNLEILSWFDRKIIINYHHSLGSTLWQALFPWDYGHNKYGNNPLESFVSGLHDENLKDELNKVQERYYKKNNGEFGFISRINEAYSLLIDNKEIKNLQMRYNLCLGHAWLFYAHPELLQSIKENKIDETLKTKLGKVFETPCVDLLINWIQKHEPRATFIDKLNEIILGYKSILFHSFCHYDRVKSVMNTIQSGISDEVFNALIEQQKKLLGGIKVETVVGNDTDKHNQPVLSRVRGDDFTKAVSVCYEQLKEAGSIVENDEQNVEDGFSLMHCS